MTTRALARCAWCGNPIRSYEVHFTHSNACRIAAAAESKITRDVATSAADRAQVRRAALHRLARTNRQDRAEQLALDSQQRR